MPIDDVLQGGLDELAREFNEYMKWEEAVQWACNQRGHKEIIGGSDYFRGVYKVFAHCEECGARYSRRPSDEEYKRFLRLMREPLF